MTEHEHNWCLLKGHGWDYNGDGTYSREVEWACECGEFKTTREKVAAKRGYEAGPDERVPA